MKIIIEHENNTFQYEHGYQAYILDYALYNDIDKIYGLDELNSFVQRVSECYLADSNATPLGSLTDYMATNWKQIKSLSRSDTLEKFYSQLY